MRTRWLCSMVLALSGAAVAACPPEGQSLQQLQQLKAAGFTVADDADRQQLAIGLLDCLGDRSPELRDAIGYEALAGWLADDALSAATRQRMLDRLQPQLAMRDADGFAAPFAALVLAALVANDRRSPWIEAGRHEQLALAAAAYLRSVDDYRGFVDAEGWRHGVAHGADLVGQLALHPTLSKAALGALREAVAAQVAPRGHAYTHGEPLRLARAIVRLAQHEAFDADDWRAWLAARSAPAPLPDWNAAFASEAGLVQRHDVAGFLSMLYLLVQESGDAGVQERLLPGLREAIRRVP